MQNEGKRITFQEKGHHRRHLSEAGGRAEKGEVKVERPGDRRLLQSSSANWLEPGLHRQTENEPDI